MFCSTPPKILSLALDRVSKTSERMPTPATLEKAIAAVRSEIGSPSTTPRIIAEGEDRNGIPCVYWSDEPTVPAYAAKNCPEGRSFLALLGDMGESIRPKYRVAQEGMLDCWDCNQRYPIKEFFTHDCPEKAKAEERRKRRRP